VWGLPAARGRPVVAAAHTQGERRVNYSGQVRIDLHAHSNVSDGTENPADVMASAARAGLDVIALTDHDSTAGWDEASAAAVEHGVALVPGMEVSCRTEEGISVHLLSYLHDPEHPGLLEEITKAKDARHTRAERMVTLLAEDYPLTWDDVIHHVAPGATSILTSRSRYFIQHYAPAPAIAVELVRAAGGVPVFAHPVASSRGRIVGERVYQEMIDAGLAGLEINHRDNPEEGRAFLRRLASKHDLLITGSSDYHGTGKPNLLGENLTDLDVLARIEEMGTGTAVVRP
jgi:predicted metal-dependent phosphoesterase TrpH